MTKQYFCKQKEVTKIETEQFTLKELHELINREKPSEIWHSQWSSKKPFIVITEYNEDGFMWYCNGNADLTPKQGNELSIYDFLKYQGFGDCYINAAEGEAAQPSAVEWQKAFDCLQSNIHEYGRLTRDSKVVGEEIKKWGESWAENKWLLDFLKALQSTEKELRERIAQLEANKK